MCLVTSLSLLNSEKAGRKIAKNCEGLPLLILTVADILRGLDMTEEYWMKVADKKATTFTDAYEIIEEVLISSYEYLPQYLKAYFLYMGVFPQSSVIPVPKLINLWTVEEDFSESSLCQTSAYYNLTRLVSNSLVIVCKQSYNYTNKSCRLHSAYWHLGVKEARKNKFFYVLRKLSDASEEYIGSQHRLSIQNNILFGIKEVYDWMAATLTTRSLLCTGEDHKYPVRIFLNLMLLKVLDALSIRFYEFPTEVVKLLQLRYLALTHNGNVPSSISQLRRLKFLILRPHHNIKLLRDSTCLPVEIWHLLQLRYLRIRGSNLPDIPGQMWYNDHPNLVTLYVNAHSCRRGVFKHIPYLMKLGIEIELQPDAAEPSSCFEYINLLYNLESVKCVVVNPGRGSRVVAPPDHLSNLPRSLKKLSLNGLGYPWEYMSAIGSLPNLQAIKVRCCAFQGPEWETEVGEFQSLEFLLLEDIDLVNWTIDEDKCFPRLQRLVIQHCYKLKEIPRRIGAIQAMKTIEVFDCSPSVVASAKQIQENMNSSLEVVINSSWNLR